MTRADESPVTRETSINDATGEPIIATLTACTINLRVKGKPRTVYTVDYNRLLIACKNNQL